MRLLALWSMIVPILAIDRDLLPTAVRPIEYDIKLKPYLDVEGDKAFTFDGEITYVLQPSSNVREIIMNTKYLENIKEINPDVDTFIAGIQTDSAKDLLKLTLNAELTPGQNYTFTLTYNGRLQDDMTGFYKSYYVENGKTKWLATTQFQSDEARKAFPCFDEPSYKTIFRISIDCPDNFTCLSNMPEKERVGNLVRFHPTPPMSTYIIAFIVSEFIPLRKTDDNSFAIWGRPEAADMADYAFDFGPKIVREFDEYLNYGYYNMDSNIKMDHVGVPDFLYGAMENWGLITYKEWYLMVHPKETSVKYKQTAAYVLTHEIAHQWFGNLLTCRFWEHSWLNEGFATYFQFHLTGNVEEFGLRDQFIVIQLQSSLLGDMYSVAPEDASPRKGASILRMMEHLMGPEKFKEGLQLYVKDNAYHTVIPQNLYDALDAVSDLSRLTVNEVMSSFISQKGYPLLTVHVDQNGRIHLQQETFNRKDGQSDIFHIPITYVYEHGSTDFENTRPQFILSNKTHEIQIDGSMGWIVFNVQQTGFYRVKYDNVTWFKLTDVLKNDRDKIHKYNRAQIIDDALNLARENYMDVSMALDIVQFLEIETEYAPWSAAYAGFSFLRESLSKFPDIYTMFNKYVLRTMKKVIEIVGFDPKQDDGNLMKIFRINTFNLACELGHDLCIKKSLEYFNDLIDEDHAINPDLREYVYCNGLRYGNEGDFDFLWRKYDGTNVANEKIVILTALGCSRKQQKIMELFMKTIDVNSGIRPQDRLTAFNAGLRGNLDNINTALQFMMNNISEIKSIYGSGNLRSMCSNLAARLPSDGIDKFEQFVSETTELSTEEKQSIKTEIEKARQAIRWTHERKDEIREWLLRNDANSMKSPLYVFSIAFGALCNYFK